MLLLFFFVVIRLRLTADENQCGDLLSMAPAPFFKPGMAGIDMSSKYAIYIVAQTLIKLHVPTH